MEQYKKTLLIAEDNPELRTLLKRVLNADYLAIETKDGLEAWAVFNDGIIINGVLTDTEMPNMGGLELIAKIRDVNKDIPIICMSGEPDYKQQALNAGANEFLLKPFNLSVLIEKIKMYLD